MEIGLKPLIRACISLESLNMKEVQEKGMMKCVCFHKTLLYLSVFVG